MLALHMAVFTGGKLQGADRYRWTSTPQLPVEEDAGQHLQEMCVLRILAIQFLRSSPSLV